MKKIIILFIAGMMFMNVSARHFVHPGILHTKGDLERIRHLVEQKVEPSIGSFVILKADRKSHADYQVQGPFQKIAREENTVIPKILVKKISMLLTIMP